jgi:acid stress-induced BolA-like protein IbaG/YrbA
MEPSAIKALIEAGLPGAQVSVHGDGRHFEAIVVSEAFRGKSMLQQHRMVYATLGERMRQEEIHALSIRSYTPEEWAARGGQGA